MNWLQGLRWRGKVCPETARRGARKPSLPRPRSLGQPLMVEQLEARILLSRGFQFPIGNPLTGSVVTQYFGQGHGTSHGHLGTDFRGSQGTPIYAAADGVVTQVTDAGPDWGMIIIVFDQTTQWGWDKDVYTMYAHVTPRTGLVKGTPVSRGDPLGTVGPKAQTSDAPHLHFEIRSGSQAGTLAGPGYLGHDFNRTTTPNVQKPGYNITWYDSYQTIANNLYAVSASFAEPTTTPGGKVTVNWHIDAAALPKTGPGSTIDLSKVSVTVSMPTLTPNPVMIQPASPNPKTGAGATLTVKNDLDGFATFTVPSTAAIGMKHDTYVVATTGPGAVLTTKATAPVTVQAAPVTDLQSFRTFFGTGSSDAQTQQWIQGYVDALYPNMHSTYPAAETFLYNLVLAQGLKLARLEQQSVTGNAQTYYQNNFPKLLSDAFGAQVYLPTWDYTKPTLILVHGILNTAADANATAAAVRAALNGRANVLSLDWGYTILVAAFRRISDHLNDTNLYESTPNILKGGRPESELVLTGAVNLNLVVKFLAHAYQVAGVSSTDKIDIAVHSQGTILATAGLSFATPATPAAPANWLTNPIQMNSLYFMGANLSYDATDPNQDISRIQASIRQKVNLHSHDDGKVNLWTPSARYGAGFAGFKDVSASSPFPSRDAEHVGALGTIGVLINGKLKSGVPVRKITHASSSIRTQKQLGDDLTRNGFLDLGWWEWFTTKLHEDSFQQSLFGAAAGSGIRTTVLHGAAPVVPDYDTPMAPENPMPGSGMKALVVTDSSMDLAVGGAQNQSQTPDVQDTQSPPTFTGITVNHSPIFRGEILVLEVQNPADPDQDLARADVFRDLDGNDYPDTGEYVASNYYRGGPLRIAIATDELPAGTNTFLVMLVDQQGHQSDVQSITIQVAEPGAPPNALPATIDPTLQPDYTIIPHSNGDIAFDPADYVLPVGRAALWQLTPSTGGGFQFRTTGTTDTVLGLYDGATGQLLQFDEDNGSDHNAQITATLTANHPYVLAIAAERNTTGNYGFVITGPNQAVTAAISTPSPLYSGSYQGNLSQAGQVNYFQLQAPAGSTSLDVRLAVSANLDGWVRVEDQAHQTVATAFLSPAGQDDVLSAIPVVPGQEYDVTVAGLNGTTGNFTLVADFSPDDPGLPDQLTPLPTTFTPLVTLPNGTLTLAGQQIATPAQFVTYMISPEVTGTYTFETFGDLDTQEGLYLGNGQFLQKDDDSGSLKNARLSYTLTAGNDYFLIVRAEATQTGSFDLSVVGPAESVATLVPRSLASTAASNFAFIANNGRYLRYQVTAPDNATSLALTAEVSASSPGLDVSIRVTDVDGNVVATANSQGPGVSEQLPSVPVQPNQTYDITLYGESRTTGDVRLLLDFSPDYSITVGSEFPVNTTTAGGQEFPGVGRNAAGASVVAWSNSDFGRIDAQRFGTDGQPVGGEFRVNKIDLNGISQPHVAVGADGSFVVAWVRGGNLYLRRFNSQASPLTDDVQVNSVQGASEAWIAMGGDGRFVLTWSSFDSRDPNGDIYLRRYDASGNPQGTEVRANTTTTDYQGNPTVAMAPDNSFLVVWHGAVGQSVHVYGQGYDTAGNPVGGELRIDEGLTGNRTNPRVAIDAADNKVVVWQSQGQDGSGLGIYARKLDAANNFVGGEFLVNSIVAGDQTDPAVAMGSQGKFLIIWVTSDSSGSGIGAQQFGVNGSPMGPEYVLNQTQTQSQLRPAVASDGDTRFLCVWNSYGQDGSSYGVYGREQVLQEVLEPNLTVTDSAGSSTDRYVPFGSFASSQGPVTQMVTISNQGNAPLTVSNLQVYGADAATFALSSTTDFTLAPQASRQLQVTFTPRNAGDAFAGVTFTHNDTTNLLSDDSHPNPYWISLQGQVTPGAADHLVFLQQPSTVAAGSVMAPPVLVVVEDANNNVVTSDSSSVTLSLATNPGSSSLGGTVMLSAVNGIATFSDLTLNRPGNGYVLQAARGGLTTVLSSTFNVTAGAATQLAVTTLPPVSVSAGSGFGLTVSAEDAAGNVDGTFQGSVTLALVSNPGNSTLGGTLTVTASQGVAAFTGLTLNNVANGYTLEASSGGLSSATTGAINVVAPSSAGQVYYTEQLDHQSSTSGRITRAGADGLHTVTLVSGLEYPRDVTLDLRGGKMYWVNGANTPATSDQIQRANLDGTGLETILTLQSDSVRQFAVDSQAGLLYYGNRLAGGGQIFVANLDGSNAHLLASGAGNIGTIVVDHAGGKLYWNDGSGNLSGTDVARVNLDGSGRQVVVPHSADEAPGQGIGGLAIDGTHAQLYAYLANAAGNSIVHYNLDGSSRQTVLTGTSAYDLQIDASQGILYGVTGSSMWKANLDGTGFQVILTGLHDSQGMAFQPSPDNQPPKVSITQQPAALTNSTSATFAFTGSDNSTPANQLVFMASLDAGTFSGVTSPVSYSSLAGGSHTFRVEAIDQAGNVSTAASYTWTVDTAAPTASLTQQPPALGNSTSATFAFTGTDNVTAMNQLTFKVSLDNAAFASATSPVSYTSLTSGSHTFQVEAIDQAGNTSVPVSYSWTVDTTAPSVTITQQPSLISNSTSASFAFTGSDNVTTAAQLVYKVRLDGSAFAMATSPASYSGVAEGSHTFQLEALDQAGNVSTAASYTWTVDTTAPTATFTQQPPLFANFTSATFAFTGSDNLTPTAQLLFKVNLDGGTRTTATSPVSYTNLAAGNHTFTVEAIDQASNVSTVASYTWIVDTTAPTVSITQQPASLTRSTSATFAFSGSDNVTAAAQLVFKVSLDGGTFAQAVSPVSYSGLTDGSHTFKVEALDQASNVSTVASTTWNIDTAAPTSTIAALARSENATPFSVSWSGSDGSGSGIAGYSIFVSDNGGAFQAFVQNTTQTSATFSGSNGHTYGFYSVATDNAGNVQPTPSEAQASTRVVLPTATQLVITTPPPGFVLPNAGFGFAVTAENIVGDVDPNFTDSVTVALSNNPGSATLGGTLTVPVHQGVATFSGLTLDHIGSGYTLQVTSNGLNPATTPAINVTGISSVALAPGSVLEFRPTGTSAGTFTSTEAGNGHSFTYTLVSGAGAIDNTSFTIAGSQLLTADAFDSAAKASYSVRVRSTDENGLLLEQPFIVSIQADSAIKRVGRTLTITGNQGSDTFGFVAGAPRHALTLNGVSLAVDTASVDTVVFQGGSGTPSADLTGGSGTNTANLTPAGGSLSGPGYTVQVNRVATLAVHGRASDTANLNTSPAVTNTFSASPGNTALSGSGYSEKALGFGTVVAYANPGDSALAYLYDAGGANYFTATPSYAYLNGATYWNEAVHFTLTEAIASAVSTDTGVLYDTSGSDTFVGTATQAYFFGTGFFNEVYGFAIASATAAAGTSDTASLYDGAGVNTFRAYPTYAYLTGAKYLNYAVGFKAVADYQVLGQDSAYLTGSGGADLFTGTSGFCSLQGTGFANAVVAVAGSLGVQAIEPDGSAAIANLYAAPGSNQLIGRGSDATLFGPGGYTISLHGFHALAAWSKAGGTGVADVAAIDFVFAREDNWQ